MPNTDGSSPRIFVVFTNDSTRLHCIANQPVVGQLQLGDMVRFGKGLSHGGLISKCLLCHDVIRSILPNQRGSRRACNGQIASSWQLVIFNFNQLCSIHSLSLGFRNNSYDCFSYITHNSIGKRMPFWLSHRLTIRSLISSCNRKRFDPISQQIFSSVDCDNSFTLECLFLIYAGNSSMSQIRTDEV